MNLVKVREVVELEDRTIRVKDFVSTFEYALALGNGYPQCNYGSKNVILLDLEYDRLGIVKVVYRFDGDDVKRTVTRNGAGYNIHYETLDNIN